MTLTEEQSLAINATGCNLIISAAAGSGKTSVLIKRLMRIITDEANPTPIENILTVTFTNNAAYQLKSRLAKELAAIPKTKWLLRQIRFLPAAKISTIHSFCIDIIRNNCEQFDITSDFRLMEEYESKLLISDAVKSVLETEYENSFEDMVKLNYFFCKGSDENLEKLLTKLYEWTVQTLDCKSKIYDIVAKSEMPTDILFAMAESVHDYIKAEKIAKNAISLSDAEPMVLELLQNEEIKKSINFKHILIDEEQDTNDFQDKIFTSISDNNLFLVGDIKQAIYRFRNANPSIFINKFENSIPYEEGNTEPSFIRLNRNFRSTDGVIDFVNALFSKYMNKECGEIDYTEDEFLIAGHTTPVSEKFDCKTVFLQVPKDEEEKAIAHKIKSMLEDKTPVFDDGKFRPCRPEDFAILMRNHKEKSFATELEKLGIPAEYAKKGGFLSSREVAVAVNFLRIINNPLLDVPFASVLLSPMFSFTDTDLARIRLTDLGIPLYKNLLKAFEETDGELFAKVSNFLEMMDYFKDFSACFPVHELLREIYEKTDTFTIPNLLLLAEHAKTFSATYGGNLSDFVKFIDKMAAEEKDLEFGNIATESENAVNIKTIHTAKGLEFPFVFLVNPPGMFHAVDNMFLYSDTHGMGFKYLDKENGNKIIEDKIYKKNKLIEVAKRDNEQIRLLYVALTRAKNRLFITHRETKQKNFMWKWFYDLPDNIAEYEEIELPNSELPEDDFNADTEKIDYESADRIKFEMSKTTEYDEGIPTLRYTVTELISGKTDEEEELSYNLPKFIENTDEEETDTKGKTYGTTLHEYMQEIDFENPIIEPKFEKKINSFFQSNLYRRIQQAEKIEREREFFVNIDDLNLPTEVNKNVNNNGFLMGIIDLIIYEDDGITLVDYKSDNVKTEAELVGRHHLQLKIYKSVLEKICTKPIKDVLIYSFHLNKEIRIE
jgi:ATP-dependent helicase/nuclease subunit A